MNRGQEARFRAASSPNAWRNRVLIRDCHPGPAPRSFATTSGSSRTLICSFVASDFGRPRPLVTARVLNSDGAASEHQSGISEVQPSMLKGGSSLFRVEADVHGISSHLFGQSIRGIQKGVRAWTTADALLAWLETQTWVSSTAAPAKSEWCLEEAASCTLGAPAMAPAVGQDIGATQPAERGEAARRTAPPRARESFPGRSTSTAWRRMSFICWWRPLSRAH